MKTLFVSAKVNFQINLSKINSISKKLPKKIVLAYSIQYQDIVSKIKKILSKNHDVTGPIQVLGCSNPKISSDREAILLIGSGKFHAISLAVESKLPVFIFENNNLVEISKEEINSFEKKKKSAYINYLNEDKIGILVSTKPGQQKLVEAIKLKKKISDKKTYLFIANELNTSEFENFGLKSWVNTACPRMDMASSKIINANELKF